MERTPWSAGQIVLLSIIILAVLGLAGAGAVAMGVPLPFSCQSQSKTFLAEVEPLARAWDDAANLADSTPRMSLPPQIDKLQALRRQAQDLDAPTCAAPVKMHLIATMDHTINGFVAFLAQKPELEVTNLFMEAQRSLDRYGEALVALK